MLVDDSLDSRVDCIGIRIQGHHSSPSFYGTGLSLNDVPMILASAITEINVTLSDRHPLQKDLSGPDIAAQIWDKIADKRR